MVLEQRPSKKSIKRVVERIYELTVRARTWQETTELVEKLNRTLGLSRHRKSGVSGARQLFGCAVASVVALQAQGRPTRHANGFGTNK
jgi:ribosomal protein L23